LEFIDYYETLGVPKSASADDIAKAYRRLARQHHPDVSKAKDAEENFKRINEAYEVLKDPAKRATYDRYGAAWKEAQQHGGPAPGFEGYRGPRAGGAGGGEGFEFEFGEGADFSDFFRELFGFGGGLGTGRRTRSTGGRRRVTMPGTDQEARIALGLEEAAHGGKREISLHDPRTGRSRTLAVNIPKGVHPGSRIRLAGQGDPGSGGGEAGDLYLEVEIAPHPLFRLEGDDLYTVLPITPWTATVGGEAMLRTLDGTVKLKIPAGSSSGRRIRLAGRGFPNGKGAAGDLFVEVQIAVPPSPTPEERELLEKLARSSHFAPPPQHS
jgi:curved DNA-binding protein